MNQFNLRVYGLFIRSNSLLVIDEERFGTKMTKFPGGGLDFGESVIDCLKREWQEELDLKILVQKHFYTTDFFQQSAFNPKEQIISIYYFVDVHDSNELKLSDKPFEFGKYEEKIAIRFCEINENLVEELTFPIDKHVAKLLLQAKR